MTDWTQFQPYRPVTAPNSEIANVHAEIPTFDYDYWKDPADPSGVRQRDDWKNLGIHWHCHSWRGDGAQWSKYGYVHPDNVPADIPPNRPDYWLKRPASHIKLVAKTPEEAHEWIWDLYSASRDDFAGEVGLDPELRRGVALYDLRCGTDISWGFWLHGGSTRYVMTVVSTSAACH